MTCGTNVLGWVPVCGTKGWGLRRVLLLDATYEKVLGVNLAVLGLVEVLLCDEDTLAEEVLVDCLAVGLGNQPGSGIRIFEIDAA